MITQIQGLQHFVANHLADVMDWSKHVRPELDRYPKSADGNPLQSGDYAYILIMTPLKNRYRMSIASSYLDPPPGAPLACKSLGTVTFHDLSDNSQIVGPKADQTWTDISKHIHVRELTDALAQARRELAEGNGSAAKLVDLGERAKKWGIVVKVPEGTVSVPNPAAVPGLPDIEVPRDHPAAIVYAPVHSIGEPVTASRDAPWLGAPILYITNPGEQIGGMQEIVGWCVKVYSHDRISIFMTPDHSEPSYRDNLPRRGSPAGNGNVHRFNCWDFNQHFLHAMQQASTDGARVSSDISPLRVDLNDLSSRVDAIFTSITRVCDRLEVLEAKRGPGRPPNPKPADSEVC